MTNRPASLSSSHWAGVSWPCSCTAPSPKAASGGQHGSPSMRSQRRPTFQMLGRQGVQLLRRQGRRLRSAARLWSKNKTQKIRHQTQPHWPAPSASRMPHTFTSRRVRDRGAERDWRRQDSTGQASRNCQSGHRWAGRFHGGWLVLRSIRLLGSAAISCTRAAQARSGRAFRMNASPSRKPR